MRAKALPERGVRGGSSFTSQPPFPQPFWTEHRKRLEQLEVRTARENNGGERRENQHHTLHGEKTPLVELVSPPIPLVMEERCPLRSFQC